MNTLKTGGGAGFSDITWSLWSRAPSIVGWKLDSLCSWFETLRTRLSRQRAAAWPSAVSWNRAPERWAVFVPWRDAEDEDLLFYAMLITAAHC
jgi:hypothetical protein